ncbi:MAG: hypothetical protein ACKVOM_07645 [Ferruginibacter sp.]
MTDIKSIGEKALIENCPLNKEWAQKELYDMYSNELFAICWRYASDNNEAKDVLREGQDEFLHTSSNTAAAVHSKAG